MVCIVCDLEEAGGSSAEGIILPILHIMRNTYLPYELGKTFSKPDDVTVIE